jgi:hypothetical protein
MVTTGQRSSLAMDRLGHGKVLNPAPGYRRAYSFIYFLPPPEAVLA